MTREPNLYEQLIEWVFDRHWVEGSDDFVFDRTDIELAVEALGVPRPKNLGDVLYSFRFRRPLPHSILRRAPNGLHWVIKANGRASYRFKAVERTNIDPDPEVQVIQIPDATPAILRAAALNDEQALLALVRYNRLIDTFLGLTAYSLQNHLRTSAEGIGQAEIDEIYVAVDREGVQYILPVQAKGGSDRIGYTQVDQDLAVCEQKFPSYVVRPVAVQFMADGVIALFELTFREGILEVVLERHYKLSNQVEPSSVEEVLSRRLSNGR